MAPVPVTVARTMVAFDAQPQYYYCPGYWISSRWIPYCYMMYFGLACYLYYFYHLYPLGFSMPHSLLFYHIRLISNSNSTSAYCSYFYYYFYCLSTLP